MNPHHGYWNPPAGTQALMVNFKNPDPAKKEALTNVDFRRAMSMSIDRETIIDIAFYGAGTVNDFGSGLGYAFEAWSDEGVHNKYKQYNSYDPEGAQALLEKAGFKDTNGDGFVETPSGKKFELLIQSPNGWTDFNNTVQLAVEQLNEVGIKRVLVLLSSRYTTKRCLRVPMMWLTPTTSTVQIHTYTGTALTTQLYKTVVVCLVLRCTTTKTTS